MGRFIISTPLNSIFSLDVEPVFLRLTPHKGSTSGRSDYGNNFVLLLTCLSIALCITLEVNTASGQEGLNMLQIGGVEGATNAITQVGDRLYIGAGTHLLILNVSNPNSPFREGEVRVPDQVQSVAVNGNIAYLALGGAGVQLVDVTTPTAPLKRGIVDTPGFASDVAAEGGHAYVADRFSGLRVIDVSNVSNPIEVASFPTPADAIGVGVRSRIVYVAAGQSGLRVIDATNPIAPVELASALTFGLARRVRIASGKAYVAAGEGGLRIFDILSPANPFEIGSYKLSALAWDVAIDETGNNLIPVPDLKATNSFSRISDSGDLLRISSRLIQIWYQGIFGGPRCGGAGAKCFSSLKPN